MELRDCRLARAKARPGRPGPPLVWLLDCCRHAGLCWPCLPLACLAWTALRPLSVTCLPTAPGPVLEVLARRLSAHALPSSPLSRLPLVPGGPLPSRVFEGDRRVQQQKGVREKNTDAFCCARVRAARRRVKSPTTMSRTAIGLEERDRPRPNALAASQGQQAATLAQTGLTTPHRPAERRPLQVGLFLARLKLARTTSGRVCPVGRRAGSRSSAKVSGVAGASVVAERLPRSRQLARWTRCRACCAERAGLSPGERLPGGTKGLPTPRAEKQGPSSLCTAGLHISLMRPGLLKPPLLAAEGD